MILLKKVEHANNAGRFNEYEPASLQTVLESMDKGLGFYRYYYPQEAAGLIRKLLGEDLEQYLTKVVVLKYMSWKDGGFTFSIQFQDELDAFKTVKQGGLKAVIIDSKIVVEGRK